jgi:putative Mn2+ efflux pump MntP
MLRLLLFVLPLGLDTLGVSISLGIKSQTQDKSGRHLEIMPVTLSAAKGLARRMQRSFAALRMTARTPLKSAQVFSPNVCKSGAHDKSGVYRSVECGDPAWGAGNIQHVSTNCPPSSWGNALPPWLGSALLFSLAETVMPLVGLTIGYAVSLFLSSVMHILGPLLLIGVGLWELLEEVHERISRQGGGTDGGGRRQADAPTASLPPLLTTAGAEKGTVQRWGRQGGGKLTPLLTTAGAEKDTAPRWGRQLLLALSVSLDELAIGFSLGAITSGLPGSKTFNTIALCILIGLQGFLMTLIGLMLGRTLRVRLKFVKEWTEFLSCFLLIALGIWLLTT